MINNCTVETIPASADATALLSAPCSLALSVLAPGGAAIAGLAPAKCRLFHLLLAIF